VTCIARTRDNSLLRIHGSDFYANVPACYVIRCTLLILF